MDKNEPKISEETKKQMAQFFLKTSIPRIMESRKRGDLNENKRIPN